MQEPLAVAPRDMVQGVALRFEGEQLAQFFGARPLELAGLRPRPSHLLQDLLEADTVLAAEAEFESRESQGARLSKSPMAWALDRPGLRYRPSLDRAPRKPFEQAAGPRCMGDIFMIDVHDKWIY